MSGFRGQATSPARSPCSWDLRLKPVLLPVRESQGPENDAKSTLPVLCRRQHICLQHGLLSVLTHY